MAVTEAADTAAISIGDSNALSLAATDAADVASVILAVPAPPKTVFITASGTFVIPSDYISLSALHGIGSGANGGAGSFILGGTSGAGGAYSAITTLSGLTASGTAYVKVGAPGDPDTWFNKSSNAAPASTADGILAKGATTGPGSGASSIGTTKFSGGDNGAAGAGGGGAGGPAGVGLDGVNGSSTAAGGAGNNGQTGGGAGGTGGASATEGGAGSIWTQTSDNATAGPGGGGGGGTSANAGHVGKAGGLYGAGGGGGGRGVTNPAGGAGRQGIIIFQYNTGSSASIAATESQDTASIAVQDVRTISITATEASDSASFALTARHLASMAASEAADTAAASVSVSGLGFLDIYLAPTEPADTASVSLSARHTAALAATEPTDSAAVSAFIGSGTIVIVGATEARDTTAINIQASSSYVLAADTGSVLVTGQNATFPRNTNLLGEVGSVVITGYPPNFIRSSFGYSDIEVIRVPYEQLKVEVAGEHSIITVPVDNSVEELSESRVSKTGPRLRVTN